MAMDDDPPKAGNDILRQEHYLTYKMECEKRKTKQLKINLRINFFNPN